jgi:hypothetical protein
MKGIIAVLIILMAAYLILATSSGSESAFRIPGYGNSEALASGTDMKRIEERMNEALSSLEAHRRAAIDRRLASGITNTGLSGSEDNSSKLPATSFHSSNLNINATINSTINSTINATMNTTMNTTNSSSLNSPALNSSIARLPAGSGNRLSSSESGEEASHEGTLNESGHAGPEAIGANSRTNFKGFYGITASQHEMGKNDIDSRTFLSGTFSMDKTVKFQDRGI